MNSSNGVTLIIDVFRAFTTAAYILEQNPTYYFLTNRCSVVKRLASLYPQPILVGKPEKGSSLLYDIPNSPTRSLEIPATNRVIIHRTEAGAKGILEAKRSNLILGVSFVNAECTARYLKSVQKKTVNIVAMGHEGIAPSFEDDLCKMYIEGLLQNQKVDLTPYLPKLKQEAGSYFFSSDQHQYPQADFKRCLALNQFDYIIEAEVKGDYACLRKRHPKPSLSHPRSDL